MCYTCTLYSIIHTVSENSEDSQVAGVMTSETAFVFDSKQLITELWTYFCTTTSLCISLGCTDSNLPNLNFWTWIPCGRLSRRTGLKVFLKSRKYYLSCFPLTLPPTLSKLPCQGKKSDYQEQIIVNLFYFGCFLSPYYSPCVCKLQIAVSVTRK